MGNDCLNNGTVQYMGRAAGRAAIGTAINTGVNQGMNYYRHQQNEKKQ